MTWPAGWACPCPRSANWREGWPTPDCWSAARDPGDRRRTLLALHERYRPQFEAYFARRIAPLTRAMDRLTPAERAGFLAGLAAWAHEAAQSADPKR
ncbi:hypothetical protein GCM10010486_33370 [Nonomuraea roseoviolacea subsp. carminata]|uniref:MarR family transcriptional regulator n=1 Tax=Nonomuraea roseoviolacea subsp. carminata TaxID=160689 RepID=A0ABT1KD87_9ACTN|nr:hypothetical protein [Nonomuraea roseoviolacea]MCP2351975.1 hypothetical protein [Nonomuraea roseoviolacea subsp. carminata]